MKKCLSDAYGDINTTTTTISFSLASQIPISAVQSIALKQIV